MNLTRHLAFLLTSSTMILPMLAHAETAAATAETEAEVAEDGEIVV